MALDGKAIKEEIPDKEVYESGNGRRNKGELETKKGLFSFSTFNRDHKCTLL